MAYIAAADPDARRAAEKWRHPEIKSRLREELEARCAYCEAFVENVSWPHVEHIIPKSKRPDLAHFWGNLTSACGRCNVAKDTHSVLDPYADPIKSHLLWIGPILTWVPGSQLGEQTIRLLRLSRPDLVMDRIRRAEDIRNLVERWHGSEGQQREALEIGILESLRSDEYRSLAEHMASALGFPVP